MKVSKLIEELFGLFDKKDVEYNKQISNNILAFERDNKIKFPVSMLELKSGPRKPAGRSVGIFSPAEIIDMPWTADVIPGLLVIGIAIHDKAKDAYTILVSPDDMKSRQNDIPISIGDSQRSQIFVTNMPLKQFIQKTKNITAKNSEQLEKIFATATHHVIKMG